MGSGFRKVWVIIVILFVASEAFFLSTDVVLKGLFLLIWVVWLVLFHKLALDEQSSDIHHAHLMAELDGAMDDAKKHLAELLEDLKPAEKDPLVEQLMSMMEDVAGADQLTEKQLKVIKSKFESQTNHEIKFKMTDEGLAIKISRKPMKKVNS